MAICSDDWLYSSVKSGCRFVDFKLSFEFIAFLLVPSLLLFGASLYKIWSLQCEDVKVGGGHRLLFAKRFTYFGMLAGASLSLVGWCMDSEHRSALSVIVLAIRIPALIALVFASYRDHYRSLRSSTALSVSLLLSTIGDAFCLRTFFLVGFHGIFQIFFFGFSCFWLSKLILFALENVSKRDHLLDEDLRQNLSPDACSGLLSRLFLGWFISFLQRGYSTELKLRDLGRQEHTSEELYRQFEQKWIQNVGRGNPLPRSLFQAFASHLLMPFIPWTIWACLSMTIPLLLDMVLTVLEYDNAKDYSFYIAGAYAVVHCGLAFSIVAGSIGARRAASVLQAALLEAITRQALKTHLGAVSRIGAGAVASHISIDIERILEAAKIPFQIYAFVLLVLLGLPIIAQQFGIAFLATAVSMLFTLIAIPLTVKHFVVDQTRWSKATDARVKLFASIVTCANAVKLSAYEASLCKLYLERREDELTELYRYRVRSVLTGLGYNTVFALIRILTLATFAILCLHSPTFVFTNRPVFVVLAVLEVYTTLFYEVIWNGNQILSAFASLKRVEGFLLEPQKQPEASQVDDLTSKTSAVDHSGVLINIREAAVGLACLDNKIFLSSMTATIPADKLTVLCGTSVGVGKTSLLLAILGEYDTISGSVQTIPAQEHVAYCSQDSVLQSDESIQKNILFTLPYHQSRYQDVITACALTADVERLAAGDSTKAIGLSGGQRQRIALARALYADTQLILLDDVLSALDNATERHVFDALFGESGLLLGKTVIFATNDIKRFSRADHLLLFGSAGFIAEGSYEQIAATQTEFRNLVTSRGSVDAVTSTSNAVLVSSKHEGSSSEEDETDEVEDEARSGLNRGLRTNLFFWLKNAGWKLSTILIILAYTTWPLFQSGFALYAKFWTSASLNDGKQVGQWIAGLFGLSVIYLLLAGSWWMISDVSHPIAGGRKLHIDQTISLLNAPLSIFDKHSVGYLTNRFSSDCLFWEVEFQSHAALAFQMSAVVLAAMVVMIFSSPWTVILSLFALAGGELLRRYYLKTGIQLRRLHSASRTPLYTVANQVSDINALVTLRAFGIQKPMLSLASRRIEDQRNPYLLQNISREWLFLGCGLEISVLVVAVVLTAFYFHTDKGILAVAILQGIPLGEGLMFALQNVNEAEVASIAGDRIAQICQIPPEDPAHDATLSSTGGIEWLRSPEIAIQNLSVRYTPQAPLALRNVNLKINAGERIGICGRTGSGKSTLLLALFRMMNATDESSIYISGQDIKSMPRQHLRGAMTVIPQESILLDLTVRENLDPEGVSSDQQIWKALEKADCKVMVEALPGKLDHHVESRGMSFSRGQRQLLALARGILRERKILCLDEASSSLDYTTDQIVQKVLRREFKNATVIVIAHRVSTILDMDRVICLDQGEIVEEGNPKELLEKENGWFRQLANMEHIHSL